MRMRIPPYPQIDIFWSNCDFAVFDPIVQMVILKAKGGYFEIVRHAMVGVSATPARYL
jgi:helicase required for RNAi-mediated heterochromatin assembly 1